MEIALVKGCPLHVSTYLDIGMAEARALKLSTKGRLYQVLPKV